MFIFHSNINNNFYTVSLQAVYTWELHQVQLLNIFLQKILLILIFFKKDCTMCNVYCNVEWKSLMCTDACCDEK